jgi:hypothetical protein
MPRGIVPLATAAKRRIGSWVAEDEGDDEESGDDEDGGDEDDAEEETSPSLR